MHRIRAFCYPALGIVAVSLGCAGAATRGAAPPLAIATLPAPLAEPGAGSYVVIDSLSLRGRVEGSGSTAASGHSLVTTYQGGRYHPEIVRALANDSIVLQRFARQLSGVMGRSAQPVLDFQASSPEDAGELTAVLRAIGGTVRARNDSLAIVVPAQDTVAYPTAVLSRVADMLIIRLDGEHRPGTPPGPPATAGFITRSVGIRASLIGASRIGVEIPLYGYIWDREHNARPFSFRDAELLVQRESGVFTRDPASKYLTASGRDGWVLWVPDVRTIQHLVGAVRRRGVKRVYLAGPAGADPAIFTQLATAH